MLTFQEASYFVKYGVKNYIIHRAKPLYKGVIVTDYCNLKCKHCTICDNKVGHIPFDELKKYLQHTRIVRNAKVPEQIEGFVKNVAME